MSDTMTAGDGPEQATPAPDDVTLPEGIEAALDEWKARVRTATWGGSIPRPLLDSAGLHSMAMAEAEADLHAEIAAALERVNDRVARYKDAHEHLKTRAMTAERRADAAEALLNTYNLGGWTDAEGPMRRALAAESRVRDLEADAARLDWLTENAGFNTTKVGPDDLVLVIGDRVPCAEDLRVSLRESIDDARQAGEVEG